MRTHDDAQYNENHNHRRLSRRRILASRLGAPAAAAVPTGTAVAAPRSTGRHRVNPHATSSDYRVGTFYFTQWNPELNPGLVTSGEAIYGPPGSAPAWWDGPLQHLAQPGPWGYGPLPE